MVLPNEVEYEVSELRALLTEQGSAEPKPPQEQTVAQECPAVHGEDCTDDHCQCDCHFSYDDPHEDSREVNGR